MEEGGRNGRRGHGKGERGGAARNKQQNDMSKEKGKKDEKKKTWSEKGEG